MCRFFGQKFCAKLFCTYILGLHFFWHKNIGTHKMLVKLTPVQQASSAHHITKWHVPKSKPFLFLRQWDFFFISLIFFRGSLAIKKLSWYPWNDVSQFCLWAVPPFLKLEISLKTRSNMLSKLNVNFLQWIIKN